MSPSITDSTIEGHTPKAKLKDIVVVDVDVHVDETPRVLACYCEMPRRKSPEALREVSQGYLNIPGYRQALAPRPIFPECSARRRKIVSSPKEMRKDLDDLGVDLGVFVSRFLSRPVRTPGTMAKQTMVPFHEDEQCGGGAAHITGSPAGHHDVVPHSLRQILIAW